MKKQCTRCKKELSLDKFHKNKKSPDLHWYRCKLCEYELTKVMVEKHKNHGVTVNEKLCPKCKTIKFSNCFYKSNRTTSGLKSYCIECVKSCKTNTNEKRRTRTLKNKIENPEKHKVINRKKHLNNRYKMKQEEFEDMKSQQNNLCAICKNKSDKILHVDHDHNTGKTRELLCYKCNSGLGQFKENAEKIKLAINYLKKHST